MFEITVSQKGRITWTLAVTPGLRCTTLACSRSEDEEPAAFLGAYTSYHSIATHTWTRVIVHRPTQGPVKKDNTLNASRWYWSSLSLVPTYINRLHIIIIFLLNIRQALIFVDRSHCETGHCTTLKSRTLGYSNKFGEDTLLGHRHI